MIIVSGVVTTLTGFGVLIPGFLAYGQQVMDATPGEFMPPPLMLLTAFTFAFFTPTGLFSVYLIVSGSVRAFSAWMDEPFGDPILTGVDTLFHRTRRSRAARASSRERNALEGMDEPDRRYPGAWADLPGADFVIVAARRKAGWAKGVFIITPDGWFTLGEPFDRPMPHGVRTIYPLTALATLDVLRNGVSYDLPPLRPYAPRPSRAARETSRPPSES